MKNLKKTLVSLFIIAAMMMSMIVVVSASSDYTTILKAYNGISADVGTMNGVWKVVEESNGNKYYSTTGGIDGMLNTPANTGKGGIIKASFDFKFTLTAGRGYVSLYNDGQQHNKANMLTLLYKDEGTMRTAGNGMFVERSADQLTAAYHNTACRNHFPSSRCGSVLIGCNCRYSTGYLGNYPSFWSGCFDCRKIDIDLWRAKRGRWRVYDSSRRFIFVGSEVDRFNRHSSGGGFASPVSDHRTGRRNRESRAGNG